VLAVPIVDLVSFTKTKMRLIKVAKVAFNVVLIAGSGGILDLILDIKLSGFPSRNVFWVNY
jgi:hypothetical protein